jgi:hypothetical protein
MAADLIEDSTIAHTFVHDLESFFWVLVWVVVSYMRTKWTVGERSSFLKDTMCPKVYGLGSGGSAKKYFITSHQVPPVPRVMPVQVLLVRLAYLFQPRYPESGLNGLPKSVLEQLPKPYEMFPEGLSNHSKILTLFSDVFRQGGWPDDDAAELQPRLPSTVELRALRTGSAMSRSQAERSGVVVLPPS